MLPTEFYIGFFFLELVSFAIDNNFVTRLVTD